MRHENWGKWSVNTSHLRPRCWHEFWTGAVPLLDFPQHVNIHCTLLPTFLNVCNCSDKMLEKKACLLIDQVAACVTKGGTNIP